MRVASASTVRAVLRGQLPVQSEGSDAVPDAAERGLYLVLGFFRETNAEALRIRERLKSAVDLAASKDDDGAARILAETYTVIRKEIGEAAIRSEVIEEIRRTDLETKAWFAREFVQVGNGWDDLDQLWPERMSHPEALAAFVTRGTRSIAVLDTMMFLCACQTIPDELDKYLANYRIGRSLDFVGTFQDQLPNKELTLAVLARLAPQSGIVSGLIDLNNAMVIKADQRFWRQAMSVVAILFTVGLGYGLVALAVHPGWFSFDASAWPVAPKDWTALNGAYLLVLLGVLAHWVLDRVKLNRSGTDVTPLSEWLMWLHVNEVPIIVRIATVWLMVALGVAFKSFNPGTGVQPVTYFTAGYFIDSTFDALVGRFNTFIGTKDPAKKKAES